MYLNSILSIALALSGRESIEKGSNKTDEKLQMGHRIFD